MCRCVPRGGGSDVGRSEGRSEVGLALARALPGRSRPTGGQGIQAQGRRVGVVGAGRPRSRRGHPPGSESEPARRSAPCGTRCTLPWSTPRRPCFSTSGSGGTSNAWPTAPSGTSTPERSPESGTDREARDAGVVPSCRVGDVLVGDRSRTGEGKPSREAGPRHHPRRPEAGACQHGHGRTPPPEHRAAVGARSRDAGPLPRSRSAHGLRRTSPRRGIRTPLREGGPVRRTLKIDTAASGDTKTGLHRTIPLAGVEANLLWEHIAAFSDPGDPEASDRPSSSPAAGLDFRSRRAEGHSTPVPQGRRRSGRYGPGPQDGGSGAGTPCR